MHVYFSGIGGAGIGPLGLIAHKAGLTVSGSDKQDSSYIGHLRKQGIDEIHLGQTYEAIAACHARQPIDWFVYTSALPMENPDAPELRFCREHGIKATKRDEFLASFLAEKQLKLLAIAGTHGKTTTTAMVIWLFKQLGIPISYSVGAKMSFGDMGEFEPDSQYFIYEADEFDRNFLSFHPHLSLITGIDWDHPDIYPTKSDYDQAFSQFAAQSSQTLLWQADAGQLSLSESNSCRILDEFDPRIDSLLTLPGHVNRLDAWQAIHALQLVTPHPFNDLVAHMNAFPGVSRRFEQIVPQLYTDYAHTPPKMRGALQLAHEVAGENVVVVYEGLHNTRQHFIKEELYNLFDDVKRLYIVPSYLAREDAGLKLLRPDDLRALLSSKSQSHAVVKQLDTELLQTIHSHLAGGDTVVAFSAGGGNSLDEWLQKHFKNPG